MISKTTKDEWRSVAMNLPENVDEVFWLLVTSVLFRSGMQLWEGASFMGLGLVRMGWSSEEIWTTVKGDKWIAPWFGLNHPNIYSDGIASYTLVRFVAWTACIDEMTLLIRNFVGAMILPTVLICYYFNLDRRDKWRAFQDTHNLLAYTKADALHASSCTI